MTLERKVYAFIETKSDDVTGEFSGYAATYVKDFNGDRIEPGAFAQSIKESRGKIPVFFNHDDNSWIGFSKALAEDHKGLVFDGKLALATSGGRDAFELLKAAEAIDYRVGMSIGFITQEWDWDGDTRLLKEIDLWEVSLTPFPANRLARVDEVKTLRNVERLLRDVGGCSAGAAKRVLSMLPLSRPDGSGRQSPTPARDVRGLRQWTRQERLMEIGRSVLGDPYGIR